MSDDAIRDMMGDAPPWPWELGPPKIDTEEVEEAHSIRAEFLGLMAHPGWQRLVAIIEAQIFARDQRYKRVPLKGMDEVPAEQYTKGESAGMEFMRDLPQVLIVQANEVIEAAKAIEEAAEQTSEE